MRNALKYYLVSLMLVSMFIFSGCALIPVKVKVPDVVGLHMEEAQELVNERSLVDVLVEGIPAEGPESEYIVYNQDPQAGVRVRKGTSVLMTHYGQKPNPYTWVRGLLTLKPLPSTKTSDPVIELIPTTKQAASLGFNLIVPYAGIPSGWKDSLIVRSMRPGKIVARFTNDEPACRKHDPYRELEFYRQMKQETPNLPVGTILCGDIGCGVKGTAPTKEEYRRQWIEVVNQMDFVMFDVYPYRKDWPDPVAKMEEFHQDYKKNITVPIIMIVQAHWSHPNQIQPDAMEQVKFWVTRGYGYIVYPWHNGYTGVRDRQEEWTLANEWAASQR